MTSTPEPPTAAAFARIKIRTGALVFCGDYVALIRRNRSGSTHYTPPGGDVEHGEDLDAALARELAEELDLDIDQAEGGDLMWVVDQRVTRPGPTPPPRKLHLIYRLHITPRSAPPSPRSNWTNCPTAATRPVSSSGSTTARPPNCRSSRPLGPPSPLCPIPPPPSPTPPSKPSPTTTTSGADQPARRRTGGRRLAGPAFSHAMRQCRRLDSHSAAGRQKRRISSACSGKRSRRSASWPSVMSA
ncbi:NUDIX hydrolase [Streptomyces sp. YPW6]|uniref:NUDIX hydrolase n=1 Tax=Streptomyces sp. YPW6 TaxID=2840373 RepID=UPI003EB8B46D